MRISRPVQTLLLLTLFILRADAQSKILVSGEFVERDGINRRNTLVEQGIPVPPMSEAEAKELRVVSADGSPLAAFIEPEARDENGRVVWVRASARIALPARGRLPVRIVHGGSLAAPALKINDSGERVSVAAPGYQLTVTRPGSIELSSRGRQILSGPWSVRVIGDSRAIIWGAQYRAFQPLQVSVEQASLHRASLVLKGFIGKNQRKAPTNPESGRRIDCELRLHLNALSPEIRFDWRITNLTGVKTWLQSYALELPLAGASEIDALGTDRAIISGEGRFALTANFIEDLGRGAGMELTDGKRSVLHGGLSMPPDGGYTSGAAPDIHRLFYYGMSRTFTGSLIPEGTAADAAEARAPVDLVLPAQYYSDTGALPEKGDPVQLGEFKAAIDRAAEWLLRTQWRGTLFWGEWYREWDETRKAGVEEASNGHSALAPLYHYWRTGDARFLHCAKRSAQYTWDVQLFKGEDGQGRMFHTRRHLFDELDWIHPRYQRATGGLIASHVFLDGRARDEIIKTIRSFHDHMFSRGIPYDWDKVANRRSDREDGVDTSNFMEALVYCYRETGDRFFLERALEMSRWTGERWKVAGKRPGDDWNWNLTNYVSRGLVTLFETSKDLQVRDLALQICRTTLDNTSTHGMDLKNGVGGGELHFVFYHAWLSTRVAKFAPDGDALIQKLYAVVKREVARQRPDGLFTLDHGVEAGMPTRWISYYEAKSLVAYVPVLTAHLAGMQKSSSNRGPSTR